MQQVLKSTGTSRLQGFNRDDWVGILDKCRLHLESSASDSGRVRFFWKYQYITNIIGIHLSIHPTKSAQGNNCHPTRYGTSVTSSYRFVTYWALGVSRLLQLSRDHISTFTTNPKLSGLHLESGPSLALQISGMTWVELNTQLVVKKQLMTHDRKQMAKQGSQQHEFAADKILTFNAKSWCPPATQQLSGRPS